MTTTVAPPEMRDPLAKQSATSVIGYGLGDFACNLSIAMTTPSVIEGRSISLSRPPSSGKHLRFHLKTGTGPLWAWLDLEAQPTLVLLAAESTDDVVSEGDVLMF